MLKFREIPIFFLLGLLFLLGSGNSATAQVRGESGLKWYSWNASGGFMMPVDPFKTHLEEGADHVYRFSGTPGFTFSLAKPVTIQLNLGAELEDHRIDGEVTFVNAVGDEPLYNARLRTYSLFFQYYIFPNTNINHFIMGKAGLSGINRAHGDVDLSRTIPADLWEWVYTAGYGVTYHMDPNFSFNLYGEFSPVPNQYLKELYTSLTTPDKKRLPMARIVLSITGHTDIRVFFPFSKPRGFTNKYKPDKYLPFYRERKRK